MYLLCQTVPRAISVPCGRFQVVLYAVSKLDRELNQSAGTVVRRLSRVLIGILLRLLIKDSKGEWTISPAAAAKKFPAYFSDYGEETLTSEI